LTKTQKKTAIGVRHDVWGKEKNMREKTRKCDGRMKGLDSHLTPAKKGDGVVQRSMRGEKASKSKKLRQTTGSSPEKKKEGKEPRSQKPFKAAHSPK